MLAPYKAAPDVSHITVGNKGAAEMVTPLVPDPLANFIGTRKEAAMRIRSTYFKVKDMPASVAFWKGFLQQEPEKESTHWSEFILGEVRLGLLLNDFDEEIGGNGSVPVFESSPSELPELVAIAKSFGATVVFDGLANPKMNAIVFAAPSGHEFELCKCT
jgi:hypothetical protein